MPILTFIDTPGASAGIEADIRSRGSDRLQSPRDVPAGCSIICTVIEVALVVARCRCGERLLMFEHAVYTVATPKPVPPFFGKMPARLPSRNCPKNHCLGSQNLGILDHLLRNLGGAHSDPLKAATILKQVLLQN